MAASKKTFNHHTSVMAWLINKKFGKHTDHWTKKAVLKFWIFTNPKWQMATILKTILTILPNKTAKIMKTKVASVSLRYKSHYR